MMWHLGEEEVRDGDHHSVVYLPVFIDSRYWPKATG